MCRSIELMCCRNWLLCSVFLDNKGVIHISNPNLRLLGDCVDGLDFKHFMKRLATVKLMGDPWLSHAPILNTYPERGNKCFQGRIPTVL